MSDFKVAIEFIRGRYSGRSIIPLHEPKFGGMERKYLLDAIDSTYVSSVGPYVDRFEQMMASISQTRRSVAVVNGTSGLHMALKLAGVKPGNEVITQALTFVATGNAILYNQAIPVFLDVDSDTMGLSPAAVRRFLEEMCEIRDEGCFHKATNRKVAACLPMHTFGFPVHMDEIIVLCKMWRIALVEDAAEALGSVYNGKSVGGLGDVAVFSLNGNKIATAGGGGAIVTNNVELAGRAKHLTTTAKRPHAYEYFHDELGYNFRMPNLNAALAVAQLEQLKEFLVVKRRLALEYSSFFKAIGVKFREEVVGTTANYWLMCIELEDRAERDLFLEQTNSNNIMTRPIWHLLFRLPMFSACYRDSQVNAQYLEARIVSIPSSVA